MTEPKKPPNKGGRPTKYTAKHATRAAILARKGCTRQEIATILGISRDTVWQWCAAHPAFDKALKVNDLVANSRVKRALFERAVGYTFEAEKIFQYEGVPVRVDHLEHVPPDVGAISLWLRNRLPKEWRDKVDIETSGHTTFLFDDPTKRPPGYQRKAKAA